MILKPCDVVLTRGSGWLSRNIRWATRERGEARTDVNHVGAIVSDGHIEGAVIVEALQKVKHHSLWAKYAGTKHEVAIYRPLNIPDADKLKILDHLNRRIGQTYGYGKIVLHLVRRLTGINLLRKPVDKWPICSYLIAKAWSSAGYHFGVDPNTATPDDIHDFVVANPDRYELIRPLGRL